MVVHTQDEGGVHMSGRPLAVVVVCRLDDIMASRNKLVEWDSDMESMSIRSSELSDWNSDVDSLSSLIR